MAKDMEGETIRPKKISLEQYLLLELHQKKKVEINGNFWGTWFFLSQMGWFEIVDHRGRMIPSSSFIRELEEEYMEHGMRDPLTYHEFMFWAWNSKTYDTYHGYDENWNRRHEMMCYHYMKAVEGVRD